MRSLLLLPLIAMASPVLAQVGPNAPAYGPAPYGPAPYGPAPYGPAPYGYPQSPYEAPVIPPQVFDPAMPAQLGRMAGALTHAFMNLPVGELEAAIAGRPATPADRRKTVGSEARRDNPAIEREIQRDVASSAGRVQSGARAMQRAMPVLGQAMAQAVGAIERAAANLPDPNYPRR